MESNKQQTAIEFLYSEIKAILGNVCIHSIQAMQIADSLQKAKEKEKRQIVIAYEIAYIDGYNDNGKSGEDYYNETFNQ